MGEGGVGEGVRMKMCVGRGVGRGCENEDVCWEMGWERV